MRALIVQAPVVGKILRVVFAVGSELTHWRWRVAAENFRDAAGLVEILLEPFEDAGDLHFLFARQKLVEVSACQPGLICAIVLFFKFVTGISEARERRTAPRRTN